MFKNMFHFLTHSGRSTSIIDGKYEVSNKIEGYFFNVIINF